MRQQSFLTIKVRKQLLYNKNADNLILRTF